MSTFDTDKPAAILHIGITCAAIPCPHCGACIGLVLPTDLAESLQNGATIQDKVTPEMFGDDEEALTVWLMLSTFGRCPACLTQHTPTVEPVVCDRGPDCEYHPVPQVPAMSVGGYL